MSRTYQDCVNLKLKIDEILREGKIDIKTPSLHEAMQNYLDYQNFIKEEEKQYWFSAEDNQWRTMPTRISNFYTKKPNNVEIISPVCFRYNGDNRYTTTISSNTLQQFGYKYYYLSCIFYTKTSGGGINFFLDGYDYYKINNEYALEDTSGCIPFSGGTIVIPSNSGNSFSRQVNIFGSNALLPPNSPPRLYLDDWFTPIDCSFKYTGSDKYYTFKYNP